jgi:hypothetical protein
MVEDDPPSTGFDDGLRSANSEPSERWVAPPTEEFWVCRARPDREIVSGSVSRLGQVAVRVLITTPSAWGHLQPMMPLAKALQNRGHEVRWATGPGSCGWAEHVPGGLDDPRRQFLSPPRRPQPVHLIGDADQVARRRSPVG